MIRDLLPEDEHEARLGHDELAGEGFDFLPLYGPGEEWTSYLQRIAGLRRGEGLPDRYVPWTDRYAVLGGVVVGRVSVRHRLTESLERVGGHIGYGVRPAYRRRGVATALLRTGLDVARELGLDRALVTCTDGNVGSAAVIEQAGGVLESVEPQPDGTATRRYWVPTA